MSLKEKLMGDMQDAMRAGDELRRGTLRMARAAIRNAEIEKRGDLDDAGVQTVLRKEIKQRRESAEEYEKGKRPELAERERAEAALLEAYLPRQMSEEDIEVEVRAIIAELGVTGPGNMKRVMPAAISRLKGRAEGGAINKVVTRVLSEGSAA